MCDGKGGTHKGIQIPLTSKGQLAEAVRAMANNPWHERSEFWEEPLRSNSYHLDHNRTQTKVASHISLKSIRQNQLALLEKNVGITKILFDSINQEAHEPNFQIQSSKPIKCPDIVRTVWRNMWCLMCYTLNGFKTPSLIYHAFAIDQATETQWKLFFGDMCGSLEFRIHTSHVGNIYCCQTMIVLMLNPTWWMFESRRPAT